MAYYLFDGSVVLGNFRFSPVESAIYAGFWVTVLVWAMWDYMHVRKVQMDKINGSFMLFWAINFVSFWLVSRFAQIAGFGVVNFWWVLMLALVANALQKVVFKMVLRRRASMAL